MIASRVRRPDSAWLLIATTVVAALLPPSHIHLAAHDDHDHDHAAAIEHSHWTSHGASRAALDDDDGRAIFVDRPARVRAAHGQLAQPHAAVIAVIIPLHPGTLRFSNRRLAAGNAPRDGPSRDLSLLRGPPLAL